MHTSLVGIDVLSASLNNMQSISTKIVRVEVFIQDQMFAE